MSREHPIYRRVIAMAIGASIGYGISHVIIKKDKAKTYASENTEVAIIIDGNIYINNKPEKINFVPNDLYSGANKEINDTTGIEKGMIPVVEYNINHLDDKTLIIYTYSKDEKKRNSVMNYIVSNVIIDENNNVYLDDDSINQQGYYEYINGIVYSQGASTQRTKSSTEQN